ncbi:transposase [Burkholderia cenocepacia]|uniref:transposase n=1 Tax=Burkholderia cenocepacia TaxID=95486 RepID=UPI0021AB140F|nr:transposase [Burkholderia cenocepacia]
MKLRGEPSCLLWRAVGEHGIELGAPPEKKRGQVATKRLFRRILGVHPVPRRLSSTRCAAPQPKMQKCVNERQ